MDQVSKTKATKAVRIKYNVIAKIYDRLWPRYLRDTVKAALEPLHLKGSENILDIGCGTGVLEEVLLSKYPNLHILGIDLSEDMLERAKKKITGPFNIEWRQGDFLTTQTPSQFFDIAFSMSNFHYFSNPQKILEKTREALKKNGLFVIIDWNKDSLKGKIYNWYMRRFDPSFNQVYSPNQIKALLETSGFIVENIKTLKAGTLWQIMRVVAKKP